MLTFLSMALVAVALGSVARHWRRTRSALTNLSVSDSWLAEQRCRRPER